MITTRLGRTEWRIDHHTPRSHEHRNLHAIRAVCSSFTAGTALGNRCKEVFASGSHDLLGSPWFVASGVLTEETMM
jgi:hypothetical protein